MTGLSPYTHLPAMPVEPFAPAPALTLTAARGGHPRRRVVALPRARHPLACGAWPGSRSRGGSPCRVAAGPSTVGVWRTELGGQPLAVKRLARPVPGDPPELSDPTHFAYWRREADVAESGLARSTPGLRGPVIAVEEDAAGITLTSDWVEDAGTNGLFVAHALGRFAAADLGDRRWLARDLLRRPDRAGRAPRRLAHPRPHQRRRPRRQPLVAPRALPPAVRRPPARRAPRRRGRGQPARPRGRPGRWPSTGRASGSGRSAPTSGCTWPAPARPPNRSSTPT